MNSIYPGSKFVRDSLLEYDLKGATFGRYAKPGEKQLKAAADARVAKANRQLEVNKLLDRLQVDGVITADDRVELAKDEVKLLEKAGGAESASYKTQVLAVTNGTKAVANADKQVILQNKLVENACEQLTLDQAKINIQFIYT